MVSINVILEGVKVKTQLTTAADSHNPKFGKGSRLCNACSTHKGLIRKYNLNICRRCFREYAHDLGFKQYD